MNYAEAKAGVHVSLEAPEGLQRPDWETGGDRRGGYLQAVRGTAVETCGQRLSVAEARLIAHHWRTYGMQLAALGEAIRAMERVNPIIQDAPFAMTLGAIKRVYGACNEVRAG